MIDDLQGRKFGRLTAIEECEPFVTQKGRKYRAWKCVCDCGMTVRVRAIALKSGNTKSCGCLSRDVHMKQDGLTSSKLYNIWRSMIKRCYSKNSTAYRNYGARGITVCEQWKNEFLEFYRWAMANGYEETLTLDRIDNEKGYSPENCRWADNFIQNNNRRTNHTLEYNGEQLTLAQWERKTGIRQETIRKRLKKGWSIEEALTIKTRERTRWRKL